MLELYCAGIFLVLTLSSLWLIGALDKMMGGDS